MLPLFAKPTPVSRLSQSLPTLQCFEPFCIIFSAEWEDALARETTVLSPHSELAHGILMNELDRCAKASLVAGIFALACLAVALTCNVMSVACIALAAMRGVTPL
jgi:hypothetical protein